MSNYTSLENIALVKFRLMIYLCQSLLLSSFNLWTVGIQLYIISSINLEMWFLQICNCTYNATSMGDERYSNNGTGHVAYHFWPWLDWNIPWLVWATQHVSPLLRSHACRSLTKHPHYKVLNPSAFISFVRLNGASILHINIYIYLLGLCTNRLWTLFSLLLSIFWWALCKWHFPDMALITIVTLKGTSWGHYTMVCSVGRCRVYKLSYNLS